MGIRVAYLFPFLTFVVFFGAPTAPLQAQEALQIAPEVVVTATRVETPVEQIGSAITVITAKDIEERNPAFVEDILRSVPGVDVGQTGGAAGGLTQVRIRGGEGNHTLVFIDGVEVNRPNVSNEFDFFSLRPEEIERIEVLRGPQSALYGSDAVGGVVNIITKKGHGKPTATFTQELGSHMTRDSRLSAGAGGKIGNDLTYHARVSASRYHTDGISAASAGTEKDGFDLKDSNAKFGLSYKKFIHLDLVGRSTHSELDTDSSNGNSPPSVVDSANTTDTKDQYGRAQVRVDLFEGMWKQKFGVSATHNIIRNKSGSGALTFRNEGKKTVLDYESVFNVETSTLVNADHTLVLGYDNEDDRQKSSATNEVNNHNFNINYQLGLAKRVFLSAGAHRQWSDFFSNVDFEDSFRFTGAYLHRETNTKIKGAFGHGVKNPTLFELFGSTTNFVGNPNLKPEQTKSWEAGLEQSFFKDKLTVDAVYFDSQVRDLITGSGTTATNIAGASIHGVELGVTARPWKYVDVSANYTWTTTEEESGTRVGSELVRRPKHKFNINTNYRFLNDKANVNLDLHYTGEAQDLIFTNNFGSSQLVTLDDYFLVNLSGGYKFNENVKLFARIENLLDQRYEQVAGFGTPGISGFAGIKLTY
jgi:vitamin B12 transporter